MDPITAMLGSSAVGAGSSLLSGLFGAGAAKKAGAQQQQTSLLQMLMQQQMLQQQQANLQPFISMGTAGITSLGQFMPEMLKSFEPTMAQLEGTPGYQFAKEQGLKTTQNAYAAKGLGQSGAALKGAATFAKDLASTTYQQQFQNYWAEKQAKYNALFQPIQLGENAALGAGNIYNQAMGAMTGSLGQIGAAEAAGTVGGANALTAGLGGAGTAISSGLTLAALGGMYAPKAQPQNQLMAPY